MANIKYNVYNKCVPIDDVRGDVSPQAHGTTPDAVESNLRVENTFERRTMRHTAKFGYSSLVKSLTNVFLRLCKIKNVVIHLYIYLFLSDV